MRIKGRKSRDKEDRERESWGKELKQTRLINGTDEKTSGVERNEVQDRRKIEREERDIDERERQRERSKRRSVRTNEEIVERGKRI
jgi:hypothetical protein